MVQMPTENLAFWVFSPSLLASLEGFRGEHELPTSIWSLDIKERF